MSASVAAIQATFSRASLSYDRSATVQAKVAELLCEKLLVPGASLIAGAVVEIGCGTGLVSSRLARQFSNRDLVFADLSKSMLSLCRERLEAMELTGTRINFLAVNAEDESDSERLPIENSALVVSSFAMQWFLQFERSLTNLLDRLPEGGQMIFALPMEGSFKEWRRACGVAGVPCTVNHLPTTTQLRSVASETGLALQFEIRDLVVRYPDSFEFFKSLKSFGATTQLEAQSLSGKDMLRLMRTWNALNRNGSTGDAVAVTYRVAFGRYSK